MPARVWLPNERAKPKRRVREKFQEFFRLKKDKHDPNVIPFCFSLLALFLLLLLIGVVNVCKN